MNPIYKNNSGVCLSVVTNRARQGGQGSRYRGLCEVPFLLKKSLGKTRGPASNQTNIQFFKKIIFIIEHIKKTRIFLKKKIEKIKINKYIKIEKNEDRQNKNRKNKNTK